MKQRTRRHQQGYVFKKGNIWYLRYYDRVLDANGKPAAQQKCRRLANAVGAYRTKQAARNLAAEFLQQFNDGTATPESSMTLTVFVDKFYLPHVETHKRKSTYDGYKKLWKRYLKPRSEISLRDFRTVEGENLLADIAAAEDLCRTTLAHIKAFLSGTFRFARRQGVLRSENPMRDVLLPKARQGNETKAYSLEEIMQMLMILPELAATIVATAAFTGARRGEIRGMLWENYSSEQIRITQSVWRRHIDEPKTRESAAPVPVIPALAKFLEKHRESKGKPQSGLMFANIFRRPLDLDKLAREEIKPALEKAKLECFDAGLLRISTDWGFRTK